jgi:hypothetical protein
MCCADNTDDPMAHSDVKGVVNTLPLSTAQHVAWPSVPSPDKSKVWIFQIVCDVKKGISFDTLEWPRNRPLTPRGILHSLSSMMGKHGHAWSAFLPFLDYALDDTFRFDGETQHMDMVLGTLKEDLPIHILRITSKPILYSYTDQMQEKDDKPRAKIWINPFHDTPRTLQTLMYNLHYMYNLLHNRESYVLTPDRISFSFMVTKHSTDPPERYTLPSAHHGGADDTLFMLNISPRDTIHVTRTLIPLTSSLDIAVLIASAMDQKTQHRKEQLRKEEDKDLRDPSPPPPQKRKSMKSLILKSLRARGDATSLIPCQVMPDGLPIQIWASEELKNIYQNGLSVCEQWDPGYAGVDEVKDKECMQLGGTVNHKVKYISFRFMVPCGSDIPFTTFGRALLRKYPNVKKLMVFQTTEPLLNDDEKRLADFAKMIQELSKQIELIWWYKAVMDWPNPTLQSLSGQDLRSRYVKSAAQLLHSLHQGSELYLRSLFLCATEEIEQTFKEDIDMKDKDRDVSLCWYVDTINVRPPPRPTPSQFSVGPLHLSAVQKLKQIKQEMNLVTITDEQIAQKNGPTCPKCLRPGKHCKPIPFTDPHVLCFYHKKLYEMARSAETEKKQMSLGYKEQTHCPRCIANICTRCPKCKANFCKDPICSDCVAHQLVIRAAIPTNVKNDLLETAPRSAETEKKQMSLGNKERTNCPRCIANICTRCPKCKANFCKDPICSDCVAHQLALRAATPSNASSNVKNGLPEIAPLATAVSLAASTPPSVSDSATSLFFPPC